MDLLVTPEEDEQWMRMALREADRALAAEEVPVGAVIVYEGRIIGRGYNQIEQLKDPTAHAEILAIGSAASYLDYPRLVGATLYTTLEPCAMCAGAIVLARIERLVFGSEDPKAGACGSVLNVVQEPWLNHCVQISAGVLAAACSERLKTFFARLRADQPY